jgi:hypothetical protein
MLTLKRRRRRWVPPQRGRGEISDPFFCLAQSNTLTVRCQPVPPRGDWAQLCPWFLYGLRRSEAALSQQFHTPPLPVTHAWVGYGWQNSRLHHFFKVQQLHEQPRVAPCAC